MKGVLISTGFYSLLAAIAVIVRGLQKPLHDLVNIEAVFTTKIQGIAIFALLSLLFFVSFFFQYNTYKKLIAYQPEFNKRILLAFGSIVLFYPLMYGLELPFIPSFIALASYTLFLDLFLDSKRLTITWCIWWIIIFSAFLSLLVFHNINKQEDLRISTALENSYKTLTSEQLELIKKLKNQVNEMSLDQISTIPEPAKIASYDIEAFYKNVTGDFKQQLGYDFSHFYCFDSKGNSLIEDSEYLLDEVRHTIDRSKSIDKNILFDPFSETIFYDFELNNVNHSGSPFRLYLAFSKEKRSQAFDDFQLYNGNTYHGNLKETYPVDYNFEHKSKAYVSNGKKFISHEFDNGFKALSVKNIIDLIKPISLFSYLFVVSIGIVLLLLLLNTFFNFLPKEINTGLFFHSLQNKLQITVIMLIVVSFIVIGFVTIYFFNNMSSNYAYNMLERKLDMTMRLFKESDFDFNTFQNTINDLHHSEDINIYVIDQTGQQLASNISAPMFTQTEFVQDTSLMLRQFTANGSTTYGLTSKLSFNDGSNRFVKIVSNNPSERISYVNDFMGTLINIYVFLFIIAGAIAIFISKPITDPIAIIGERMRQLKLGRKNEPLIYEKNDELGALVHEYNQMIEKLENSSKLIAQTERDMAWREMAKQVAHEIKNPLTPMKLSIQYLQRAINTADADPHMLVDRISQTLIEQIENLTQIANEFSNFGTLPKGSNERVSLNEVVEAIHDLFRKRDDMDVYLEEPIDDIFVFADKHHLIRILNNLVKNAMQAIPETRRGVIHLKLYREGQKAIIKVSDNGTGIPKHMREKVFTPNFTTKSSGTGLGLAISANMIETFNGKIHFETAENVGTDFYMEIPLMRNEEQSISTSEKEENRVYLD